MNQPTIYERAEQNADFGAAQKRLASAKRKPFWLDEFGYPASAPAFKGSATTDLLIVGGGYHGLWSAIRAKERYPARSVILVEAKKIAWAASGRNGGFCEPSLTHGRSNAKVHVPGEEKLAAELGEENLAELLATLKRYNVDCDIREHGVIKLATEPHQVQYLENMAAEDPTVKILRGADLQQQVKTAAATVGGWATAEGVILNPALLARGLTQICEQLGVQIYENTRILKLANSAETVTAHCQGGSITASQVILATNGFKSLLPQLRLHTVPVYDYAIVTEPLTPQQRKSLNWDKSQGVTDMNSKFHYMRLLRDKDGAERILIGGYDAVYHYGRKISSRLDTREQTFMRLALHLEVIFPQLKGIKFTHAWGGMIDTCTRFFAFFTTAYGNKVVAATGFTGLGVAATRFAADACLDLLNGEKTKRVASALVKKRPLPFPPEPFAWLAIRFTSAMMARSDRREGKLGLWLWILDKFKLGFDS